MQDREEVNTVPREKEGFRDQLQNLMDRFPGREVIDLKEAAAMLEVCPRTLKVNKTFPAKKMGGKTAKYIVPLVGLARWMS